MKTFFGINKLIKIISDYKSFRYSQKYLKEDGYYLFEHDDYAKYKEIQEEGNKRKINYVWVEEENMNFLADTIKEKIGSPIFGICHGTRRGLEQKWLSEKLNCKVIGTEISETAIDFPNTIQWDFHEVKKEWISNVDFIYSNSFDHTYKPKECINSWMSCLKPNGLCILEHSSNHKPSHVRSLDCFISDVKFMPYLICKWSNGKFGVTDIITAPKAINDRHQAYFIIIRNFNY